MPKNGIKLTEEMFFAILRENAGLFARTARAIEKQLGVHYSRQAVRDRAEKRPDILEDIREENHDVAEEGLHSLMRSKNERVKLSSIELYLKTQAKSRGYTERTEVQNVGITEIKIVRE
jgi:hypothetical protein